MAQLARATREMTTAADNATIAVSAFGPYDPPTRLTSGPVYPVTYAADREERQALRRLTK